MRSFSNSPSAVAGLLFASGLLLCTELVADQQSVDTNIDDKKGDDTTAETPAEPAAEIPMRTARLQVLNADGEPIPGANITPSGFRTKAERGSHWGWIKERHGECPVVVTDSEGMAEIRYPKFVAEQLEIGEVTWSVHHEDYVTFREDREVDLPLAKIELQRGRRVAVTAVNGETGSPISDRVFAALSGYGFNQEWKTLSNGMILSRAVDWDRDHLRVVHIPEAGNPLFSDPVFLDPEDRGLRKLLKDIPLHPGTRIAGTIDAQVPRPVLNGHVVVLSSSLMEDDSRNSSLRWSDWTVIEEDGSFVVEAVPRDSFVMLIAVCDSWISSAPTEQNLKQAGLKMDQVRLTSSMVTPQFVRAEGDQLDCCLDMEPTANCRITVTDPAGKPLQNATVHFWPNQIWPGYGSQIVGQGFRTAAVMSLPQMESQQLIDWWNNRQQLEKLGIIKSTISNYSGATDEHGVAVVGNLPAGAGDQGRSESFMVEHPEYELPPAAHSPLRRESRIVLIPGEMSEIAVQLQPRGAQPIGR